MLQAGADPDIQNGNGVTALGFAAILGHTELVWLLLDYNADRDLYDRFGHTPYMQAQMQGNKAVMELLAPVK